MSKLNASITSRVSDPDVLAAAEKAATVYEKQYPQGSKDISFNSTEQSVYTNLLNAICNYAMKSRNGKTPHDEFSENVRTPSVTQSWAIPFDQQAVLIYNAKNSGVTKWKYAPHGLVYPEESKGKISKDNSQMLLANSGTRQYISSLFGKNSRVVNYDNMIKNYENYTQKNLVFDQTTTGADAAKNIGKALNERKKLTDDFNKDIQGDKWLNDYSRLVCNKLKNNYEFRRGFFSAHSQSQIGIGQNPS